jgi:hypothetical protein
MKIKRSEIKKVLKEVLAEGKVNEDKLALQNHKELAHYGGSEYDDYQYGDPAAAAGDLAVAIDNMERAIKGARKSAGNAVGPGVIASFGKDLKAMLSKNKVR